MKSEEYINELAELTTNTVIPSIVEIADRYRIDRDNLLKYYVDLFATISELCTIKNFNMEEKQNGKINT